jgi:hypothetical protein
VQLKASTILLNLITITLIITSMIATLRPKGERRPFRTTEAFSEHLKEIERKFGKRVKEGVYFRRGGTFRRLGWCLSF